MKLTTKKLYQLIKEQVSQQEMDYFAGKDIPQFKNVVNNPRVYADYSKPHDEISKQWISNNIGEKLGSGYSRMVFEFGDNKVIKFAYGSAMKDGKDSNLVEAKLFNQFPKIFPKAYAHDPDGAWIIVDKVDIIDTRDEFYAVLPIQFPVLEDVLNILRQGAPRPDEDLNPYFLWMLLSKVLSFDFETYTNKSPMVYFLQHFKNHYRIGIPYTKKAWEVMTKDSNLMYWVGTLKNLRVDLSDIRHGNVGWSGDRMVILDISIFEEDLMKARDMLKWGEHWDDETIKVTPRDFGTKQMMTPDGAKGDVFDPVDLKESLSKDRREKLIKLLLSSVEDANMAFDLMDSLEIDSLEQLKIINDAILRGLKTESEHFIIGEMSELHQILKQKINFILIRDLEAFDLGDI